VSSFASFAEDLRHLRDLRQQMGSCVKIPISAIDPAVAHVSHQCQHVRIDKRSVTRTGLKYPDGITMT